MLISVFKTPISVTSKALKRDTKELYRFFLEFIKSKANALKLWILIYKLIKINS